MRTLLCMLLEAPDSASAIRAVRLGVPQRGHAAWCTARTIGSLEPPYLVLRFQVPSQQLSAASSRRADRSQWADNRLVLDGAKWRDGRPITKIAAMCRRSAARSATVKPAHTPHNRHPPASAGKSGRDQKSNFAP
jgi:hypothetical protein